MDDNKQKDDNTGDNDFDPMLMMEDILDKLKLLDYEINFSRIK